MKDKKNRKSRDVTIILGDSIIKDAKAWELTDESNKVVVKSFRGATKTKYQNQAFKTKYGTNSRKYHFTLRY